VPTADRSSIPRIVGVVHLPALPGSVLGGLAGSLPEIIDHAKRDTYALAAGGVNAIIVENFGDVPFARKRVSAYTVAVMTLAVDVIKRESGLPIGVNVLRNDGLSAVSIAAATGASFVRINVYVGASVTDQGLIQGNADEVQALIRRLGASVDVWADVDVKHAAQLASRPIGELAADAIERGLARAVIVTGGGTGHEIDLEDLKAVRSALPHASILAGSGVTDESVATILTLADGVIVGTHFKQDGVVSNPVDLVRVKRFVEAAHSSPSGSIDQ
jgi:membrane complex biogenesis BtpA family protein